MYSVTVDGCALGMTNSKDEPILKRWRFITSSERQAKAISQYKCEHEPGFKHGEIQGGGPSGDTVATQSYPLKLCHIMLASNFGFYERTPVMPCSHVL